MIKAASLPLLLAICYSSIITAQESRVIRDKLESSRAHFIFDLTPGSTTHDISGFIEGFTYAFSAIPHSADMDLLTILDDKEFKTGETIEWLANSTDLQLEYQPSTSGAVILYMQCVDCPTEDKKEQGSSRHAMGVMVDESLSPTQLVEEVLVNDRCLEVFNITYSGLPNSIGRFTNGAASTGMQSGVVFATGDVNDIVGSNDSPDHNTLESNPPVITQDGDIQRLIMDNVFLHDVATLEFDFIPAGDRVQFEFVFASEEYCFFIESFYNDAFAFVVSGPGISGVFSNNGKNLAVVPGTNSPISVNSINHTINSDYYIDNNPSRFLVDFPTYYEGTEQCTFNVAYDDPRNDLIECNGFTVPITSEFNVVPCDTYHMKFVLADVTDARLDAWIFLGANTFTGSTPKLVGN